MTEISFTPVVEFTYVDSMYLPELSYTARTEQLKEQVLAWAEEGKVVMVEGVPAAVAGTGIVI